MTGGGGVFPQWQPRYAALGIATFPVEITPHTKKPAIGNYDRVGLRGSAKLATATRFAGYDALGFMAGPRSGITVVDMDDIDPKILEDGERLFGPSPLVWQTGGGKFAAAYRFNGETRRIRPIRGLPIDILGGGVVVAPPSKGAKRGYEIIRGSLDDLLRLPTAQIPATAPERSPPSGLESGRRNISLFKHCLRCAPSCDDFETLLDVARTFNMEFMEPLPDAEFIKTAKSAWRYEVTGRNWAGRKARASTDREEILAMSHDPAAAMLLMLLRVSHPLPDDRFAIDQIKTAELLCWDRKTLRTKIESLIACRRLKRVHVGRGKHDPHLYVLAGDRGEKTDTI
jgi:Primase C terminal 1 (PriCT-1)/Bifunctional DNA primase/polymerase, N-terminal